MEIKFSKADLMRNLNYKSRTSLYELLRISLLEKKAWYSMEELEKLRISKSLLEQHKSKNFVLQYWTHYHQLKTHE